MVRACCDDGRTPDCLATKISEYLGIFAEPRRIICSIGIEYPCWNDAAQLHRPPFLTLFAKNPLHLIAHFHSNWKWFLPIVGLALYTLYKMDRFTEFLYFQF